MVESDFVVLDAYVRSAADTFGLRDWVTEVSREAADEGHDASADFTFGRRRVSIRFNTEFRSSQPDAQRDSVAHELVHCYFDSLSDVLRDELSHLGRLNEGELAAIRRAHLRAEELSVDALARLLAPLLPAISWTEV